MRPIDYLNPSFFGLSSAEFYPTLHKTQGGFFFTWLRSNALSPASRWRMRCISEPYLKKREEEEENEEEGKT
jgi:hypothetical protein